MVSNIIKRICNSCCCNEQEAQEHLDGEIRNLKEMQRLNDLRYDDFEVACDSLGLDHDYVAYFIEVIA